MPRDPEIAEAAKPQHKIWKESDLSRLDLLPGWEDREELIYEVFQSHCPIPEDVDTRGKFADAIIAVAQWGYQRRFEEVEDLPWPRSQN